MASFNMEKMMNNIGLPGPGSWDNTELAKGNLKDEVQKLKNQGGKDLIVYGGSSFVSELIKEELIDEFYLFLNPVVLGKGIPIFDKLDNYRQFKLKRSITFNCGIVLLNYELKILSKI